MARTSMKIIQAEGDAILSRAEPGRFIDVFRKRTDDLLNIFTVTEYVVKLVSEERELAGLVGGCAIKTVGDLGIECPS